MLLNFLRLVVRGRSGKGGENVRTMESKFRFCCLVVQSVTSCLYAIEDGLPDDGEMTTILTARYWSCDIHMDFNVGIGVNKCDRARWACEKLKPNTVAI